MAGFPQASHMLLVAMATPAPLSSMVIDPMSPYFAGNVECPKTWSLGPLIFMMERGTLSVDFVVSRSYKFVDATILEGGRWFYATKVSATLDHRCTRTCKNSFREIVQDLCAKSNDCNTWKSFIP